MRCHLLTMDSLFELGGDDWLLVYDITTSTKTENLV